MTIAWNQAETLEQTADNTDVTKERHLADLITCLKSATPTAGPITDQGWTSNWTAACKGLTEENESDGS